MSMVNRGSTLPQGARNIDIRAWSTTRKKPTRQAAPSAPPSRPRINPPVPSDGSGVATAPLRPVLRTTRDPVGHHRSACSAAGRTATPGRSDQPNPPQWVATMRSTPASAKATRPPPSGPASCRTTMPGRRPATCRRPRAAGRRPPPGARRCGARGGTGVAHPPGLTATASPCVGSPRTPRRSVRPGMPPHA
jgi:hypothetical protein